MKGLRSLILMLVLLLAGVAAAQWLASEHAGDLGQVLIRAGGYDISASLPGAVIALLLAALLLWLLVQLLALPFRAWGRHRRKRARARLVEGLELLHGGHWQRAGKLLERAAEDADVATVARLGAIRAADGRGEAAAAQAQLSVLETHNPAAAALMRAERALAAGQPETAIAALDATAAQPLPPRGLVLRSQALALAGRAGEAYGLLGPMRQQQAHPSARLPEEERRLATAALLEADDANLLAERWEALPKPLRADAAVVSAYAERAAALRWDDAATHSLEHAIESQWDEGLVAQYGRLTVDKLDSRRASAQRWLQQHPDSPALLLTLARLARLQGQWPQAQDFLHRALRQGAGSEAWEELGHGHASAGEDLLARRSYANALAARRGEAVQPLEDSAAPPEEVGVIVERDAHGLPRLRE
ncbi:heme biosynthesis protein HemY [Pseudoxanthomonas composti]|uniref:Heme biosynthesis protein HemY n=1 Tax=Pseudoxanthomonas composti TaxID=2137479 RepID=A0A4V1N135_9GAMM|nr:heme biosynthesis HemY N-terminal domain-containing protein [Pseudoxanthomonas composti]RXR05884.1 heme biosynthesis protein HemY [Pseudoxanthomonas composti]